MENHKRISLAIQQVRVPLRLLDVLESSMNGGGAKMSSLVERWSKLAQLHPNQNAEKCLLLNVPGRIEVLGKHTDYAGGFSLTCASSRSMASVVATHESPSLILMDAARNITLEIPYHEVGLVEGASWATYANTVLARLIRHFGTPKNGVTIVLESNIPSAAGLSSSSGLIITLALGLLGKGNFPIPIPALDRAAFAGFAGAIESGAQFGDWVGDAGVGTRGGSQDHTAIVCSVASQLGLFSYFPVAKEQAVPFPESLTFVIGSSGVKARKTGDAKDAYNDASDRARHVVSSWNRLRESSKDLVTPARNMGEMLRDPAFDRSLLQAQLQKEAQGASLWNRFLQFEKETEVVIPGVINQIHQQNWSGLGDFVDESQRMADEWLGNQVPETNALVSLARQSGAYAASGFGAGFGGAVWALVDTELADSFRKTWMKQYAAAFPTRSQYLEFFTDFPSHGVTIHGETDFPL